MLMLRTFLPALLALCAGTAFAGTASPPDAGKLDPLRATLADTAGHYALSVRLVAPPAGPGRSRDGRFAMRSDLDPIPPSIPHNGRYALQSKLGEQPAGTCAGTLPDPVFRDGFEN